jgi:hypothetical protein
MSDMQDKLQALVITAEKRLCKILGRDWSPSGMSFETLCGDLSDVLAAEREDAERYRWLRSIDRTLGDCDCVAEHSEEKLDAAIDRARKESK